MVNARGGAKTAIKTTELDVSGEGTVSACADKALKMLQEGRVDKVTFIGVGLQVNKAVAAVELVKKKITIREMKQMVGKSRLGGIERRSKP